MSKKSRSRRSPSSHSRRPADKVVKPGRNPFREQETRAADTITLLWVLCVSASMMALVTSFGFLIMIRSVERNWSDEFLILPQLVLMIGNVTGVLGLVLTWFVRKMRTVPAPSSMVWLAVLFCSLPSMIWIWTAISG